MSKPCTGCGSKENPALFFSEGKVLMRFIRANKKPAGSMRNFKDGELYWQRPINATVPWWEPVEDITIPLVKEATEEDSVFEGGKVERRILPDKPPVKEELVHEATRMDDPDTPAYLGPSGMTIQPGGRISGVFTEPAQVVIGEAPPHLEPKETTTDLGFPQGELPSLKWLKEDLFLFARLKGAKVKMNMGKQELLDFALNPASKSS